MKKDVNALLVELERMRYVESRVGPNGKEWRLTDKGRRELTGLPGAATLGASIDAPPLPSTHRTRRAG